ncbi:site-specific integrase [Kutzneria kofuensis]|uniref:Integrase n=1 Tax=Kutzneria kofuensis TaxID=103725 RepID=A0A7W9NFM6_9PSEU|nr:site-specific integrase [Kutzneria kofuensis]MBB5890679.1 integrase [Kutzneria kofuensis]
MARPRLSIGTYGEIRTYSTSSGKVRAVANYRDFDGITRPVERVGKSKTAAVANLKEALRDRKRADFENEITSDSKFAPVAEMWFAAIQAEVDEGHKSPGTARLYRDRLDNQVLPALGQLALSEITVSRVDKVVKAVKDKHGTGTAKLTRTVIGGVLGLATRHDVYDHNPAHEIERIRAPKKKSAARALELEQAQDLRARIAADKVAVGRDLPDFADMMLGTGMRIGEAAAVIWDALDLDSSPGQVEVRGTVVRVKGQGLYIKPAPKSEDGYRKLELPNWLREQLRRRKPANASPSDVVFTAPMGGLRDPSNTNADLKEAFEAAGYPWMTSHVWRKTVASMMDDAGLSARAAADQLGHAKVSMTQDNYFKRRVRRTGAAEVMERVVPVADPTGNDEG